MEKITEQLYCDICGSEIISSVYISEEKPRRIISIAHETWHSGVYLIKDICENCTLQMSITLDKLTKPGSTAGIKKAM